MSRQKSKKVSLLTGVDRGALGGAYCQQCNDVRDTHRQLEGTG